LKHTVYYLPSSLVLELKKVLFTSTKVLQKLISAETAELLFDYQLTW